MDPVSMGAVAVGGAAAGFFGSLLQGQGAQYEANAKANMLQYQAGVARVNQQIAEQNASYQRYVGEVQAQESGMKTRAEMGGVISAQAGSGLDVRSGTNARVQGSVTEIGQQNQALIRGGAARKAYGSELEAFARGTDAQLYGMGAETARKSGDIAMKASILGGVSNVASKWMTASQYFGGGGSKGAPDWWQPAPREGEIG